MMSHQTAQGKEQWLKAGRTRRIRRKLELEHAANRMEENFCRIFDCNWVSWTLCACVRACVSVDMCDVEERQGDGRIINF